MGFMGASGMFTELWQITIYHHANRKTHELSMAMASSLRTFSKRWSPSRHPVTKGMEISMIELNRCGSVRNHSEACDDHQRYDDVSDFLGGLKTTRINHVKQPPKKKLD